jgi:hypothetical protein
MVVKEKVDSLIQNSYQRIRHLDNERRLVEHVEGRVEPNIENMQNRKNLDWQCYI